MPRFFVDPAAICGDYISLDTETLSHIHVLRLSPKETFIVCDGNGQDYCCTLEGDTAKVVSISANEAEPKTACIVLLAYTRGERMDYAIQKSVELGAAEINLFPAERCVVKYDGKSLPKKLARWEKIALEAAKQSGRGRVPAVVAHTSFKEAMQKAAQTDLALFFYENEADRTLRMALDNTQNAQSISLVIGPEGGFTSDEVTLSAVLGLSPVSLGKRILRAETAPVAALAAVMFWLGE